MGVCGRTMQRRHMWFPLFFAALFLPSPEVAGAALADPDKLCPGGVVEYKFWKTFPTKEKTLVRETMDYITSKVPCVTFVPATTSSVNYVLFVPGRGCEAKSWGMAVMHFGPLDGSKNGEEVIHYRYDLPDETWHEPYPD